MKPNSSRLGAWIDPYADKENDLPDLSILLGCCYLLLFSFESCLYDGIILYPINLHQCFSCYVTLTGIHAL